MRALEGWSIGVTADRRAAEQCELLIRAGASVLHAPTVRTLPFAPVDGLRDVLEAIVTRPPDLLVLTTGIGIRTLFEVADSFGLTDALLDACAPAEVLVRGPKAHGAACTAGLRVSWQAPSATSRELIDHLGRRGVRGVRVAVQLDGRAQPVLGDDLRRLGAHVVDVPVYRWTMPDADPVQRLVSAICEHRVDAVTFTSSPAVSNLLTLAGAARPALLRALQGPVAAVSVGPVCTASARELGVAPQIQPARARLGAMVHALNCHAERENRDRTRRVDDVCVTLHRSTAVVDDETIDLTEREAAVLRALLARPGSVVSKATILAEHWPRGTDTHAVEVAVSRLRRRLRGRLGVKAIARRGYMLTAS